MKLSKNNKKRLVLATFLIPFFTGLLTIIGIKNFADNKLPLLVNTDADMHTVLSVIALVLFINVVASFASLISYYCLENRVNDIIGKRARKNAKK